MGMVVVVVAEPRADGFEDGVRGVQLGQVDVIAFEGLYEGFGHTVRLGRVRGRCADDEARSTSKFPRFVRRIGRAVVAEPLDRVCDARASRAEAMLNALRHQVADVLAHEMNRLRHPPDDLAVAAIEREGDIHSLAVPAADFEAIAAPTHITSWGDHLAVVGTRDAAGVARQL